MNEQKISKALTWDELANLYPGNAKIEPMEKVFNWAEKQLDKFFVNPNTFTIHLILKKST